MSLLPTGFSRKERGCVPIAKAESGALLVGYTLFFYYVGEREGIIKCQQWSDATRGRDAIFVSGSLAAGWTEPLAAWAGLFFHFGVYSLKSWEVSAS